MAVSQHSSTAFEISAVLLSLTIMPGLQCTAIRSASSRTTRQPVVHEVEALALVGQRYNRSLRTIAHRAFASLASSHGQAFFSVRPLGFIAVDRKPFALQHYLQAAITEPAARVRKSAQLLAKILIITATRLVADDRPVRRSLTSSRAEKCATASLFASQTLPIF